MIATWPRRLGWAFLAFTFAVGFVIGVMRQLPNEEILHWTSGQFMVRLFGWPALFAMGVLAFTIVRASQPGTPPACAVTPQSVPKPQAFVAQVVGISWLNPLHRLDRPTEWQLLWTLGFVKLDGDDKLRAVRTIAWSYEGGKNLDWFHEKYAKEFLARFRENYLTNESYFYTVQPEDRSKWRELAGIHIEYTLPADRLDPVRAAAYVSGELVRNYEIGSSHIPAVSSRDTPPDVRVTTGGPNAGFVSLAAALDYLQAHPQESVWVMSWDAPSYPKKDGQINENMLLLVLAGPEYETGREALAWLGYPAFKAVSDFEAQAGRPPRRVQAWKAAFEVAAQNANQPRGDIGFMIHDAGVGSPAASERIGPLAQTLAAEWPEFDFDTQMFDSAARLGDMGAGAALTNVALGIAYANHVGRQVLVAGSADTDRTAALVVLPPEKARSIDSAQGWFCAVWPRDAYLPWWALRHDAPPYPQGYSC